MERAYIVERLEKHAVENKVLTLKIPASISGILFYEKVGYKKGETFTSKNAGQQTWMTKEISYKL